MSRLLVGTLAVIALSGFIVRDAVADTKADAHVKAICVKVFERQRECTDSFIPALVDARVVADQPPGIAARAKREGRAALIDAAKIEWAADSKDSAIASTCENSASTPRGAALASASEKCLAEKTCNAFVPCVISALRDHLGDR